MTKKYFQKIKIITENFLLKKEIFSRQSFDDFGRQDICWTMNEMFNCCPHIYSWISDNDLIVIGFSVTLANPFSTFLILLISNFICFTGHLIHYGKFLVLISAIFWFGGKTVFHQMSTNFLIWLHWLLKRFDLYLSCSLSPTTIRIW